MNADHFTMSNIGAGDAHSADTWKEPNSLTGKDIIPTNRTNHLHDSGSRNDNGKGDFCTDICASTTSRELTPLTLDDVLSEEVDITIKQVIEDSVQRVLVSQNSSGNHGNMDQRTLEALTNSVEESLQGMITELNVAENEDTCMQQCHDDTKNGVRKLDNIHSPQNFPGGNLENQKEAPKDTKVEVCKKNKFYLCDSTQVQPCVQDGTNGKIEESVLLIQGNLGDSDVTPDASVEETENFRNWKEAGKALRLALSKYAQRNEDEKSSKQDVSNNIQISQSLECLQTGNSENEVTNPNNFFSSPILHPDHSPWCNCPIQSERRLSIQDAGNSAGSRNLLEINGYDEACLARSMQQSLSNDPMNQMWEDYQNTHVPLTHSTDTKDTECCNVNPPCGQETCESTQTNTENDPNSFTSAKDPTLSELRERMRTLMSSLPISKNKSVLGSRENDSLVVSSDSGIVRSPKNTRRRHYKPSKETRVAESDEEMESNLSQKSLPKIRNPGQRTTDITKDSQNFSAQNRQCKFRKQTVSKLNDTMESLPDLVSDSHSDLNSSQDSYKECLNTDKSNSTVHSPDQNTGDSVHVGDRTNIQERKVSPENSTIKHTESMLNFADVDSTESERVASKVEPTSGSPKACVSACVQSSSTSVSDDDDLPSLDSLSSTDEDEIAASILREKYKGQPEELDSSDLLAEEDFDMFGEMPDLVGSTDDTDDEYQEITLSCEDVAALQEINISDSSLDGEEGIEGDDEFECDCNLCQRYQPTEANPITQDTTETDHTEAEESRYYEDFSPDFRSMPSMDDVDVDGLYLTSFLNPLSLLTSETNRRGLLDLMFTNVIMHMLSVYPELLNDQTPEPLPPNLFEKFALIRISEDESQCPICLCTFELGEEAKQLPCDHVFHSLCIQAWLCKARTCPVCRHILTDPPAELPGS